MVRYFHFVVSFLLFAYTLLYSTTYTVNQDGSGNFTVIQQAIDQSAFRDTILVFPGFYYENIIIRRSITLQSLYVTNSDTCFIYNTIIRGERSGSVINVSGAVRYGATINGFTIMNDRDTDMPTVDYGGGINLYNSDAVIKNNIIKNCTARYSGGGIFTHSDGGYIPRIQMENNEIYNNLVTQGAGMGGGIYLGSQTNLTTSHASRNSIYDNTATHGLDIYIGNRSSDVEIYLNKGSRLLTGFDYFFINYGDSYNFEYLGNYVLNILHESLPSIVNNVIYLSPTGDDANTGLSVDSALRTIDRAARLIAYETQAIRTIQIAPGTYSPSQNGQRFPISLPCNVNLLGSAIGETIINGEGHPTMLSCLRPIAHNGIANMTITNFGYYGTNANTFELFGGSYTIENILFENNYHSFSINLRSFDTASLQNVTVRSSTGAAFYIIESDSINMNNVVIDNLQDNYLLTGCLILSHVKNILVNKLSITNCDYYGDQKLIYIPWWLEIIPSEPGFAIFNNVLIANNQAYGDPNDTVSNPTVAIYKNHSMNILNNWTVANNSGGYSSLRFSDHASGFVNNSIFFNPNHTSVNEVVGLPVISNSLLFKVSPINGWYYPDAIETLLNVSPIFAGMVFDYLTPDLQEYYYLHESSPCVDMGMADVSQLDLPVGDLAGNQRVWNGRIDMGAFEYGAEAGINEETVRPLTNYNLINYPNPFNPETIIQFSLVKSSNVTLGVYNIKGQLVRSLVSGFYYEGLHSVIWNGKDDKGVGVSSGIYFYRLSAGYFVDTKKMMLLK